MSPSSCFFSSEAQAAAALQHGQLPLATDEPSDLGGQLTRIVSD